MREREWCSKPHAKHLRQTMTKAEIALWSRLKSKQLNGYKFRRQHPVDNYVADFACISAKLIIEVDGSIHERALQQEKDAKRDRTLSALGWKILRFSNEAVLYRTDEVLNDIALRLPPPTGFAGHLPRERGRSAQAKKE
ncbi:MAG: DUF559 domain-containing protein [Pseudomonadota bacterium]